MNTLATHFSDYDRGIVTRDGYLALRDAETHDQATSVSACSSCLARVAESLARGPLQLFDPAGASQFVEDMGSFRAWASTHFPHALDYLDRYGH